MIDTFPAYALLLVLFLFFLIALWKRNAQMGKRWSDSEGKKLAIQDKELHCLHCSGQTFRKMEGLLNTTIAMFFHFGFWNKSAACYACIKCGFLHWFLSPEEKIYKEFGKDEL